MRETSSTFLHWRNNICDPCYVVTASVARSHLGLTEFLTPFNFVWLAAPSINFLKSQKYLYTHRKYIRMCLSFHLKKLLIFSLAKRKVHSELLKQALDSFIAHSTGLLKSSKFLYTLHIPTYIILYLNFGQIQSVSLALRPGHFRVAEISFYIRNPRWFWNSVNGDYKIKSHDK